MVVESLITKLKLIKLQKEYMCITKFINDLQSHIELLNNKLVINNVNKNMIMHDLYNILAKKDESINSLYNTYIDLFSTCLELYIILLSVVNISTLIL